MDPKVKDKTGEKKKPKKMIWRAEGDTEDFPLGAFFQAILFSAASASSTIVFVSKQSVIMETCPYSFIGRPFLPVPKIQGFLGER
ncbi:hypothetical protein NPIL_673331 [Nephila pilipes]|uniref:Uncharacterized protein n=1 Tax=Nephila pilipes TaxID=299642 RepID=A0A8X6QH99_NEPPI|nr:hypothetical protein NPIL_673331 [Nephila pilipes]